MAGSNIEGYFRGEPDGLFERRAEAKKAVTDAYDRLVETSRRAYRKSRHGKERDFTKERHLTKAELSRQADLDAAMERVRVIDFEFSKVLIRDICEGDWSLRGRWDDQASEPQCVSRETLMLLPLRNGLLSVVPEPIEVHVEHNAIRFIVRRRWLWDVEIKKGKWNRDSKWQAEHEPVISFAKKLAEKYKGEKIHLANECNNQVQTRFKKHLEEIGYSGPPRAALTSKELRKAFWDQFPDQCEGPGRPAKKPN